MAEYRFPVEAMAAIGVAALLPLLAKIERVPAVPQERKVITIDAAEDPSRLPQRGYEWEPFNLDAERGMILIPDIPSDRPRIEIDPRWQVHPRELPRQRVFDLEHP